MCVKFEKWKHAFLSWWVILVSAAISHFGSPQFVLINWCLEGVSWNLCIICFPYLYCHNFYEIWLQQCLHQTKWKACLS